MVTFTTDTLDYASIHVGHVINLRSKVGFYREVRARHLWFHRRPPPPPVTAFSLETAMSVESPKWTEGLSIAGLYYDGIVDGGKLDKVLELHKRDRTVSTFGTHSSRRVSQPKKKQVVHDENKPQNEQVISESSKKVKCIST